MAITEDYVSLETAKLLKEKGFDSECDYLYVNGGIVRAQGGKCNWNKGETIFTDYKNECSAPTLQMAMKWLREKHIVVIPEVETFYADGSVSSWEYHLWYDDNFEEGQNSFSSYEEAAEAAIKYCLESLI